MFKRILLSFLLGFVSCNAHATKNVSSPAVNADEWRAEARFSIEHDGAAAINQRIRQQHLIEYGINDWYAVRIVGRWVKPDGEKNDFTFTEWEHRLQFFEADDDGFDGAMKLVYVRADNPGDADVFDVQWLGRFEYKGLQHTANASLDRDIGASRQSSVAVNLAWKTTGRIYPGIELGAEWHGDLGRLNRQRGLSSQSHQMGSVVSFDITESVSLETGYLVGLTPEAPNGMFKFFIKSVF